MSADADQLEAWRNGDAAAGEALFDRYFGRLYSFFSTKVSGGIDDLAQETFLACIEQRDRLRDASCFRAFLFGVARRRLYRRWRDEYRGAGALDFTVRSVADVSPSPSTRLRADEQQHALLDALRTIPAEMQMAIELYYWEGFTAAQVAEVMEVPGPTAQSRLRRAREKLRASLQDRGFSSEDLEGRFRKAQRSFDARPAER